MKIRKIIHIIYRLDVGGLETVLVSLINKLSSKEFSHVIICLTTYTSFKDRLCNDNVSIISMNKKPGKDTGVFFRILKIILNEKPHIVHTYNLSAIEYQVAAFVARVRLRVHAEHGRDFSDLKGENFKYILLRKIINLCIHFWVPVSKDLAQWLEGKVRIPQRKIVLIYNGIDVSKFTPSLARIQSWNFGVARSGGSILRIVSVGRLDPIKDQATLLKSLHYISKRTLERSSHFLLRIAGEGPERKYLQQIIYEEDLCANAQLLGEVENIAEFLNSADIFVLSSLAEGIPMTILEASAAGLPVIATDVGGIPEIVHHDETGLLVPPGSPQLIAAAIRKYIDEPELLLRHGMNGRQFILEHFSLAKMTQSYEYLYKQC